MSTQYLIAIFWISITVWCIPSSSQKVEDADLQKWSNSLKTEFATLRSIMKVNDMSPTATAYPTATYSEADAEKLRGDIVADIKTKVITNRATIVEKLATETEKYHTGYTGSTSDISCSKFIYDRAKAISNHASASVSQNKTEKCQRFVYLNLTDDPLLYNIGVTKDLSTAHVPTNVYDGSREILMVANWTNQLDTNFKKNLADNPTLKWQYFGSREGMLKIYPGVKWHVQINQTGGSYPVDFFDCRSLPWYIMAAACPKHIMIIVDKSGSMTGKRVIIANRTISEILLSLTENDYFNIIHINQTATVVDPAYNETMIQASMRNVHRIINLLNLQAKGIANYSLGLRTAFEMLKTTPSDYIKAMFVVGDGLPFAYDNIFKEYNADKSVRIFAYLIGKEATEVTNMRNMACNNNGYYAHIMTLSDVKENVLKYLPVMARAPKKPKPFTVWTGPHVREVLGKVVKQTVITIGNSTSNETVINSTTLETHTLFASVARAAYDLKKKNLSYVPLLGVVGLDVPIDDFIRLTRKWSLGVFGYVFMINNNGFVLFHPNLRPIFNGKMKPFFQNTDLARVEHPVNAESDNGHPTYDMTVRTEMIGRKTGKEDMTVYNVPDDFKSAFQMKMKYFFAPLPDTPYCIAVALPWDSSKSEEYLKTPPTPASPYDLTDFSDWLKDYCNRTISNDNQGLIISPYEFCHFKTEVATEYQINPVCALRSVIKTPSLQADCDKDFIKRVQRDAQTSKTIFAQWKTETSNWKNFGIDQVFVLFHSGLIKFYNSTMPREVSFITNHSTRAMEDDLFQTTLLYARNYAKPDLLYFHPPSPKESQENSSITVTSMVYVKTKKVPIAVAGLQIGYEELKTVFMDKTSAACTTSPCLTCNDSNVDCYLLATNGYVIASAKNDTDVGKFIGAVDANVMESMLSKTLFTSEFVFDFQGVCNYSTGASSFATRLIDPITFLIRWMVNMVCTVSIFVAQLCITLLWALISTAEVNPPYNVTRTPAWNSCAYKDTVYLWKKSDPPKVQSIDINACTDCKKELKAMAIDNTNLILLTVKAVEGDRQCSCGVNITTSEKLTVNRTLLILTNRKYPEWKCEHHPKDEKGAVCGHGNTVSPPHLLSMVILVTFLILNRYYG